MKKKIRELPVTFTVSTIVFLMLLGVAGYYYALPAFTVIFSQRRLQR